MDHIDLRAYIATQKSTLESYQEELRNTISLQSSLEKYKPVRWYHTTYYIIKRVLLTILAILCLLIMGYILVNTDHLKQLYDQYLAEFVTKYANELLATKISAKYEIDSPFYSKVVEDFMVIKPQEGFQTKISNQAFQILKWGSVVILTLIALMSLYISRLTRIMHDKNKIIEDYYQSTLDFVDGYKELIKTKKRDIEFLSKISKSVTK